MGQATMEKGRGEEPTLKARLLSRALRTRPLFQGALWTQMPLLAMVGPRVTELDRDHCTVEIPFTWRNRNVFGTMYFAASMMAAEATTGGLVFYHQAMQPRKVSFIVKGISADFVDKAQSTVRFECRAGEEIAQAFEEAQSSSTSVERTLEVVGWREDGREVARVQVDWWWRCK